MPKNNTKNSEEFYEKQNDNRKNSDHHVCLHCNNPFPSSAGVVTPDAAICDVCNGD